MINLHSEFTGNNRRWYPHVGAAIGIVDIAQEVRCGGVSFDDDDSVFGGQAMAGLSYVFNPTF